MTKFENFVPRSLKDWRKNHATHENVINDKKELYRLSFVSNIVCKGSFFSKTGH